MIDRFFDLHGLVRIRLTTKNPDLRSATAHHLRNFQSESFVMPNIVIQDYERAPEVANGISAPGIGAFNEGFLDIPHERISFNLVSDPITIYCERYVIPLNLFIQLALLRQGATFVHAAGVEINGQGILFPAFGGVGKTILVAAIVFDGGRLFGDDLVIVKDSTIYSYAQDLSVYPYHVPLLRLNNPSIERAFERSARVQWFSKLTGRSDNRAAKLIRLIANSLSTAVVNVPAEEVFGAYDWRATSGSLSRVTSLERSISHEGFMRRHIPAERLADASAHTLLHEWHGAMHYFLTYCALAGISLGRLTEDITMTMAKSFSKAEICERLEIPNNISASDYQRWFLDHMNT